MNVNLEDMLEHGTVISGKIRKPDATSFLKAFNILNSLAGRNVRSLERIEVRDDIVVDSEYSEVSL